jgi:hypothetical protein
MKCSEFEYQLSLVTEFESNDSPCGEDVIKHAASCRACATYLQGEQLLSRSFAEIGAHIRQISPSLDLEQRIMKAFDRERQITQPYSRKWARYAVSAIAATLVVAGVSFALLRHQPGPASRGANSQNDLLAAAGEIEPGHIPEPAPLANGKSKWRARSPRSIRNGISLDAAAPAVPSEIATDFIRINYATPIEPGSQIVRVQLPRSAMSQFGLPVNMDRADQPVKADVIMGIDGMAQAIRFVQ